MSIDPRPEAPLAVDEATSWADGTTHEALLVIAEGITQLAGFDVAAVSVVRDSQHMQVMAVAGSDEARDTLQGTYTPITRLMEELEHAEDWGMFKFVPHETPRPRVRGLGLGARPRADLRRPRRLAPDGPAGRPALRARRRAARHPRRSTARSTGGGPTRRTAGS